MKSLSKGKILIFVVLLVLAVVFRLFNRRDLPNSFSCEWNNRTNVNSLVYVNHALCRMKCRDITKSLVEDVYRTGKVNYEKRGLNKGKPHYALEKEDPRGDIIRVIVQDNGNEQLIITTIRLDQPDKCECS